MEMQLLENMQHPHIKPSIEYTTVLLLFFLCLLVFFLARCFSPPPLILLIHKSQSVHH